MRFSKMTLSGMLLAMCLATAHAYAHDDDDEEEGRHQRHEQHEHSQSERDRHASNVSNPKLREECGSCHIVYPPNMLPADSWREIMEHLDRHFGSDASLDRATQRELAALLQEQADRGGRSSGRPVLRITETAWFRDAHDEEVSPRTWRNPKVKSAANCGACHTRADQGRFGENEVRIPR